MPKETLASMNISLPITSNCDNCPQPNSSNATAENCPCLRFEIRDVCFKRPRSCHFYVSQFVIILLILITMHLEILSTVNYNIQAGLLYGTQEERSLPVYIAFTVCCSG